MKCYRIWELLLPLYGIIYDAYFFVNLLCLIPAYFLLFRQQDKLYKKYLTIRVNTCYNALAGKMKYTYPVIFENDDGKIGVRVPDISGCFTFGDTVTEAIEMAEDAIAMMLAHYEDNNQAIPKASNISDVKIKDGFVNYVIADTDKWRRQFSEKSVKKTVTIPAWLNYKAETANLNFSQELQNALKAKLQVGV